MSLDAKDIFLSNNYLNNNECGYNIRNSKNSINLYKFINTLDYCLDLIQLREIYRKIYRRKSFTFKADGKEYCQHVINVTFKYSCKEYNRIKNGLYIKDGYSLNDITLTDNACVINGELIAIQTYSPLSKNSKKKQKYNIAEWKNKFSVLSPLPNDVLGAYFSYEDGVYKAKENIKTTKTVAELRHHLYEHGFVCDGIKYVRWKRSAGSARVGKCLFINERLYKLIHQWEMCGIEVKQGQSVDLAALESYISLTLSSIIDTVQIKPENILVVNDYKSVFNDSVISTDFKDGKLKTDLAEVQVSNNIWDGQSLLDVSMFGKYSKYGMILLRSRFFKSCCFNSNIQKWFKDGGITDISQLNGFTVAKRIEDIRLITTPNSIKFLKFGSLNDWLQTLDTTFGIVKHDKPTYFWGGRMVQAHYQLLNTLQLTSEEVGDVLSQSFDYINKLKTDVDILRHHIGYQVQDYSSPESLITQNDIIYKMLGLNSEFAKTKLYDKFRQTLINAYVKNLRKGHVLINGSYCTLFGNPIEMLEESTGVFNGVSKLGVGNVHCSFFEDGETLLGSRSPHVAAGNVWLTKNTLCDDINEYFNLTKEIVCVNSIGENLLERLSGADFDSDTSLLTNNKLLIEAAKRNYDIFHVPTKLVESTPKQHKYAPKDLATLDIKTSVNKIGEIINLSQELNSKIWDKMNSGASYEDIIEIYKDLTRLDIMSNLEIDSAKRENPANNVWELKQIKERYTKRDKKGRYIRPLFFKYLDKDKGFYDNKRKTYKMHSTTMDYLQLHIDNFRTPYKENRGIYISFSDMLKPSDSCKNIYYNQVNKIIDIIRDAKSSISNVWQKNDDIENSKKYEQSQSIKNNCIQQINSMVLNKATMYHLLKTCEQEKYSDISSFLFFALFSLPNETFWDLIIENQKAMYVLQEKTDGEIQLYGFNYSKILQF